LKARERYCEILGGYFTKTKIKKMGDEITGQLSSACLDDGYSRTKALSFRFNKGGTPGWIYGAHFSSVPVVFYEHAWAVFLKGGTLGLQAIFQTPSPQPKKCQNLLRGKYK
jgi:hypothetical protein